MLPYHSFPLPRITGSRCSLRVMLPVPDSVFALLPADKMRSSATFSVTPVLFNIGINEKASIAGRLGQNGPQEKNNADNYKIVHEYYRRYKKLGLQASATAARNLRKRKESPHSIDMHALKNFFRF